MKRIVAGTAVCIASMFLAACFAVPGAVLFSAVLLRAKENGHWGGNLQGVRTEIFFDSREGIATLRTSSPVFGLDASESAAFKYEIDDSGSPIYIDFILPESEGRAQQRRVKGIMNYISDTVLTICVCLDGTNRPGSFKTVVEQDIYSIVLSRTK